MDLKDVTMNIAVVVNNKDNQHIGRIKVASPGEFDTAVMDSESLPWVYPLTMGGYQRFSKMPEGSKVWLIKNNTNIFTNEYWYIPYYEQIGLTSQVLDDTYNDDTEILLSRDLGGSSVVIAYDNVNGITIQLKNNCITISHDSTISITAGNSNIIVNDAQINIGKSNGDFNENAVKGGKLIGMLKDLQGSLENLANKCSSAQYCSQIYEEVQACADSLDNLDESLSNSVYIN